MSSSRPRPVVVLAQQSPDASDWIHLELAALEANLPPEESAVPSASHARAARRRVLIVDDDADMRAHLRACLAERWAVAEAGDGQEALARIAAAPPALVVTDVEMPRLDGRALCRRLKQNPRFASIPVVLLSAAASHGADAALAKPFTRKRLLDVVGRFLADTP